MQSLCPASLQQAEPESLGTMQRRHNIPTSLGDTVDKFTCMQLVQRCVLLSLSLLGQKATKHLLDNPRVVERIF